MYVYSIGSQKQWHVFYKSGLVQKWLHFSIMATHKTIRISVTYHIQWGPVSRFVRNRTVHRRRQNHRVCKDLQQMVDHRHREYT